MATQIRVGIVGCGRIAERNHIPGFLGVDGCEITALCDIVPEKMTAKQEAFSELGAAHCFADSGALFQSDLVDAVAICTPNDCHHPQTLAACRQGLHVLCEKPMAPALDQATEMIEAAHDADVVLQINQSLRYNALYQTVADLVREGAVGEPFHCRCLRAGSRTPNKGWSPGADWFVQKKHSGGLLLDIGIHMADLMRMVMGPAVSVGGLVDTRLPDIDVPDNVNALYRYENGGTGVLELSWTLPGGAGFFEVYGTKGRIRLGFSDEPIQLWQEGQDAPTTFPKPLGRPTSQAVFRQAILGEGPSWTPGEYGRRALALCLAVEESSRSGAFVDVTHFPGDDTF